MASSPGLAARPCPWTFGWPGALGDCGQVLTHRPGEGGRDGAQWAWQIHVSCPIEPTQVPKNRTLKTSQTGCRQELANPAAAPSGFTGNRALPASWSSEARRPGPAWPAGGRPAAVCAAVASRCGRPGRASPLLPVPISVLRERAATESVPETPSPAPRDLGATWSSSRPPVVSDKPGASLWASVSRTQFLRKVELGGNSSSQNPVQQAPVVPTLASHVSVNPKGQQICSHGVKGRALGYRGLGAPAQCLLP